MPKNRLKKRQVEYLKLHEIYLNPQRDDPYYQDKKSISDSLKALNDTISKFSPYRKPAVNPAPNNDGAKKGKKNASKKAENAKPDDEVLVGDINEAPVMSKADINEVIAYYSASIHTLSSFTNKMTDKISELEEEHDASTNAYERRDITRRIKSLKSQIKQIDLILNTLSKDLRTFNNSKDKDNLTINDIYEDSRVRSDYQVVEEPANNGHKDQGAQNERIHVKIKSPSGEVIDGFFTPDNVLESGDTVAKEIRTARSKYGKAASFISTSAIKSFYSKFSRNNKDALTSILFAKEELSMMKYTEAVKYLSKNMGSSLKSYINTPEKLKMFVDVASAGFREQNKVNINEGVGIEPGSNINRRNAAMSKMAELLGCPDAIAFSENMKLTIGGKTYKGTFMKSAKGFDSHNIPKDSLALKAEFDCIESLKVKKQIGNLQILDYLCGNPDRHGGNMLYDFTEGPDGLINLNLPQGIDNDTSWGSADTSKARMTYIPPNRMKVITKDMQQRIMAISPQMLEQVFYGYGFSTAEINAAKARLDSLKDKLTKDTAKYANGYTKGYIIPGTIKIVEDEELSEMTITDDLCNANPKNLFEILRKNANSNYAFSCLHNNLREDYIKSVYNLTVGNIPDMNKLIGNLDNDTFWGGSSEKYDKLFDDMKELKKSMIELQGPLLGKSVITNKKHIRQLVDLKTKVRIALSKANDYIQYKDNKNESWRHINGPHKPNRQERRYRDAENCRDFLNKMLNSFNDLDKKLQDAAEVSAKNNTAKTEYTTKQMQYLNSERFIERQDKRSANLYRNHLSRTKFQVNQTYNVIKKHPNAHAEEKAYYELQFAQYLGFGLAGLKEADRNPFLDDIRKSTGLPIAEDTETLIKNAVAADMIILKLSLEDKLRQGKKLTENEKTVRDRLKSIKVAPLNKAAETLLNSAEFKAYYEGNKEDFLSIQGYDRPEASIPTPTNRLSQSREFENAYFKVHPEEKKFEEVPLKKVNIKNQKKTSGPSSHA